MVFHLDITIMLWYEDKYLPIIQQLTNVENIDVKLNSFICLYHDVDIELKLLENIKNEILIDFQVLDEYTCDMPGNRDPYVELCVMDSKAGKGFQALLSLEKFSIIHEKLLKSEKIFLKTSFFPKIKKT